MVRILPLLLIPIFVLTLTSATLAGDRTPIQPMAYQRAMAAYNSGDHDRALDLIAPLAVRGMPAAQTLLGDMYRSGNGVEMNRASAEEWYKKAAFQDYLPANVRLEELRGVNSQRTAMIRPRIKPSPPVRSSRSVTADRTYCYNAVAEVFYISSGSTCGAHTQVTKVEFYTNQDRLIRKMREDGLAGLVRRIGPQSEGHRNKGVAQVERTYCFSQYSNRFHIAQTAGDCRSSQEITKSQYDSRTPPEKKSVPRIQQGFTYCYNPNFRGEGRFSSKHGRSCGGNGIEITRVQFESKTPPARTASRSSTVLRYCYSPRGPFWYTRALPSDCRSADQEVTKAQYDSRTPPTRTSIPLIQQATIVYCYSPMPPGGFFSLSSDTCGAYTQITKAQFESKTPPAGARTASRSTRPAQNYRAYCYSSVKEGSFYRAGTARCYPGDPKISKAQYDSKTPPTRTASRSTLRATPEDNRTYCRSRYLNISYFTFGGSCIFGWNETTRAQYAANLEGKYHCSNQVVYFQRAGCMIKNTPHVERISKQEFDTAFDLRTVRPTIESSRSTPTRTSSTRPAASRSRTSNRTTRSSSESAVADREHSQCLSYGLTFGTQPYSDCRLRLGQQRAQKEYLEQARAEEDKRRRRRAFGAALTEMGQVLLKTGKYAPPPPAPVTRIEVRPQSSFTCIQRPIYRGLGSGGVRRFGGGRIHWDCR